MAVWLSVNRLETEKGVWTVVRVEGDTYGIKDQIKACRVEPWKAFRYGFPFDLFVAFKQHSGLDSEELTRWLDANADRHDKRWATYTAGAPEINRGKIDALAADLAQRCGMITFPVRETQPLFLAPEGKLGTIGADPGNGVGLGDEDVAPAGPAEEDEWTDPDTDPDLPF